MLRSFQKPPGSTVIMLTYLYIAESFHLARLFMTQPWNIDEVQNYMVANFQFIGLQKNFPLSTP